MYKLATSIYLLNVEVYQIINNAEKCMLQITLCLGLHITVHFQRETNLIAEIFNITNLSKLKRNNL